MIQAERIAYGKVWLAGELLGEGENLEIGTRTNPSVRCQRPKFPPTVT